MSQGTALLQFRLSTNREAGSETQATWNEAVTLIGQALKKAQVTGHYLIRPTRQIAWGKGRSLGEIRVVRQDRNSILLYVKSGRSGK
jgi:hypothetical protein